MLQAIAGALKTLPNGAADRFCNHFGVTRIKDLPARQVEKAVAYLDMLKAECQAMTRGEVGVDPFA